MKLLRHVAFVLLLTFCTSAAWANGRMYNSVAFHINPSDANDWLLATTFGLLVSRDAGNTWDWLCEQAANGSAGFGSTDPVITWTKNGAWVIATFSDVIVSRDGGCSWQGSNKFSSAAMQVADLALDPVAADTWYVASNNLMTGRGVVFRTSDGGATYQELAVGADDIYFGAVRVVATEPRRIYVVGWNQNTFAGPFIGRSDDAGSTWELKLASGGPSAAVSPTLIVNPRDPDMLFLAVSNLRDAVNPLAILRSVDGGKSVSTVLARPDTFRNFAFGDDGKTLWLATTVRILRSGDAGASFIELASPVANACVAVFGDALYGCGSGPVDNFALARSTDGGAAWKPLFTLNEIRGPLACPAGSAGQMVCPPLWPQTASTAKNQAPGTDPGNGAASAGTSTPANKEGCTCSEQGSEPLWCTGLGIALVMLYLRGQRLRRNNRCELPRGA